VDLAASALSFAVDSHTVDIVELMYKKMVGRK
jgi:hypothetical protein